MMQKTQQELINIADKILAQLENDYLQTQQFNLIPHVECPEEEAGHEDYHVLDGDDEPDHMPDSNESQEESEPVQGGQKKQIEDAKVKAQQKSEQMQVRYNLGQLVEVFPTEQWKAPDKQININSQKIMQMSLNMNLPVPQWMKDEVQLKNRITELFGKKVVK